MSQAFLHGVEIVELGNPETAAAQSAWSSPPSTTPLSAPTADSAQITADSAAITVDQT